MSQLHAFLNDTLSQHPHPKKGVKGSNKRQIIYVKITGVGIQMLDAHI